MQNNLPVFRNMVALAKTADRDLKRQGLPGIAPVLMAFAGLIPVVPAAAATALIGESVYHLFAGSFLFFMIMLTMAAFASSGDTVR